MMAILAGVRWYLIAVLISVQLSHSVVSDFATLWTAAHPVHHQLPEFTQTHVHWVGDAIQLSHPLILFTSHHQSVFPTISIFSNELVLLIRWLKDWSFSFSTSHSSEYSGLISFRIDWLDLLAVQGTLRSLLQHRSSKAFFSAQVLFAFL